MHADTQTQWQIAGCKGGVPETIPLNLVVDYPVRWSRYKVLRDLLQNFYDAVGHQAWQQRFSYTHRRYDFSSWYPVIKYLIERVADSAEQTQRWRDKHPGLLVAERVKRNQLPEYNRRRQALDWVRQERRGYRLVQDGFYKLGYPRLETACEQADGFSRVREPQGVEVDLIRILEELTATVLDGFFGNDPIPPCKVIDAGRAAWEGMTVTLRMSEPRKNLDGLTVRYRLPWVALKSSAMTKCGFPRAWSTYLHERAHCFGGDQSAAFSLALTHLLQTTLRHGPDIARAEARWVEACERQS